MNIYDLISKYKSLNISMILVTAVAKSGSGPVAIGKKMLYIEEDKAFGTVGGGALEYYAREKCKTLIKTRENLLETYYLSENELFTDGTNLPMACGGKVSLFYEYLGPKETIYIFGAGHVGQAIVNVLKTMNFHVTVIDDRKPVIDNFKGADVLVNKPFVKYVEEEKIKENSFVIICTPNHENDYHVINKIIELKIKLRYMGMLCSPEKLDDYLKSTYKKFGKNINLNYFYSPIGLDLGGESPEEIAISIIAEILAISYGKENHLHMRSVYSGKNHYWKD